MGNRTRAFAARLAAAAIAGALLLAAPPARADRPACTETPSDAEVRRRLEVIEGLVRDEEPPVRRWFTSFALLHGTMLSGSTILAATAEDEGTQAIMTVGAVGSALALTTLVIFVPPLMGAGDTLASLPESDPEARLHKLRVAEDILRRAAGSVDFLHGWFGATATSLYVAAMSSVLLIAFEQTGSAFSHLGGGLLLGIGRILLRPTGGRTAWQRYQRAYPDAGCEEIVPDEPEAGLHVTPFGLQLRF